MLPDVNQAAHVSDKGGMNDYTYLRIYLAVALCWGVATLNAQTPPRPGTDAPSSPSTAALPRTFLQVSLGMSLQNLKDALHTTTDYFSYTDPDVTYPPGPGVTPEETILEAPGRSFVRRATFQLHQGAVWVMAFTLNPALMDHYSVFTALVKKYGEPTEISPGAAVWESGDTRLSLERPLTVKYIDKRTLDALIAQSHTRTAAAAQAREDFLNGL